MEPLNVFELNLEENNVAVSEDEYFMSDEIDSQENDFDFENDCEG
jgi:hypothetical protein